MADDSSDAPLDDDDKDEVEVADENDEVDEMDEEQEADGDQKTAVDQGVSQYLCDYCRKDISGVIRIRCHDCADFNLCLDCFAGGVELNIDENNDHKRTHRYRVVDHVTDAIFEEDWGADEELMLLEGVERYGVGNWSDVATHLGVKAKTKQRCEQHYHAVYLNSATKPLPDPSVRVTPSAYPPEPTSYDIPQVPSKAVPKGKLNAETIAAGFRPKRGEFDTEFDQSAEEVFADMEMSPDDPPLMRRLKLKVLDAFNRKVDGRHERKKFAIDRNLIYTNREMKHKSKEFKQLYQDLKVFARFHSPEEHMRFVEDLFRERALLRDIEELRERRSQGIRTFPEELVYVEEKTLRDMWIANANDSVDSEKLPSRGMTRQDAALAAVTDVAKRRPKVPEEHVTDGIDISNMECVELLSPAERVLCAEKKLIPRHYNLIKSHLVLKSYTYGWISPSDARATFDIDADVIDAIYVLLLSMGLINSEQPPYPPPPYSMPPPAAKRPPLSKSTGKTTKKTAKKEAKSKPPSAMDVLESGSVAADSPKPSWSSPVHLFTMTAAAAAAEAAPDAAN